MGLLETREKFNRLECGQGVEYISTMRGQDDERVIIIIIISWRNLSD